MLEEIAEITGIQPILRYSDVRPGDQPLYISNTDKFTEASGWRPRFSCRETLQSIHRFWHENRALLASQRGAMAEREMVAEEVA